MVIAFLPKGKETMSLGTELLVEDPSPNWPLVPSPQQVTEPLSSKAQVCVDPAERAVAVRPGPKSVT